MLIHGTSLNRRKPYPLNIPCTEISMLYKKDGLEVELYYNNGYTLYIYKNGKPILNEVLTRCERVTRTEALKDAIKLNLDWYLRDKWFWFFSARNNNLKYLFKKGEDHFAPRWIKTIRKWLQ